MQRYRFYANNRDLRELRKDDDGDVVLFTDAQAKSLADEQRIYTLEKTLRLVLDGLASGHVKAKLIIEMDPDAEQIEPKSLEQIIEAALRVGDAK